MRLDSSSDPPSAREIKSWITIIGGYDDSENADPLKITFVYKTGFTDDITFCGLSSRAWIPSGLIVSAAIIAFAMFSCICRTKPSLSVNIRLRALTVTSCNNSSLTVRLVPRFLLKKCKSWSSVTVIGTLLTELFVRRPYAAKTGIPPTTYRSRGFLSCGIGENHL